MKSFRIFSILILGIISLTSSASARLISSFESDLNGWTIAPGTLPARATVVSSFNSFSTTISPTDGSKELWMIAGFTSIDPAGTQFASILNLNNPIHVNAGEYLLMDVRLAGRQPRPEVDWLGLSINDIAYSALDTLMMPTSTSSPWETMAVLFPHGGFFTFGVLCVNGSTPGANSYCAIDNIRTADTLPSVAELARYPLVGGPSGSGILNINLAPPVSAVPEPKTWVLMLLGLLAIGFQAYRRQGGKIHFPSVAVAGPLN